ncbi:BspA family leucine-rich repeat surface protein [Flagellimonas marinaquae]
MRARFLFLIMVSFVLFWSCEPNEPDSVLINNAPVVPSQTFTVPENFPDGQLIGRIQATDKDGDALEFSLLQDASGLFEVTQNGNLFLALNKKLSYEGQGEHTLTVYVHDGTVGRSGSVAIKVTPEVSEDELPAENEPPTADNQEFEVNEDIADDQVIGTVTATDPEEDTLTFAITENDDDLFVISESGELTLVEGTVLDFETKANYTLTISVEDGVNLPVAIAVTVNLIDINEAPIAEDQEFTVDEDITEQEVIGTVTATDPEEDALTFTITENDDDLFAISEGGELTLAEGMQLDFENKPEHSLTIEVSDGTNDPVTFAVTINVGNVMDSLAEDPEAFVLKFTVTAGQELTIGTNTNYNYDFTIDWGDGTVEDIAGQDPDPSHPYEAGDTYTVAIKGNFPALRMSGADDASRNSLVDVAQWGAQQWQSMESAFRFCDNLVEFSATDAPDLTETENMSFMFMNCDNFNGAIGHWDTSNVTNMGGMFFGATVFNQPLVQQPGGWNTSNVTDMTYMFSIATSFNQDLSSWDTSNVTDMFGMFFDATSFNQPLVQQPEGWNTSNVANMGSMFAGATAFDQSLGNWDISSVTDMSNMLDNCGMSPASTNATIIGWADFVDTNGGPTGITLGMQGLTVCGLEVDGAGLLLMNTYSWVFNPAPVSQFNCP